MLGSYRHFPNITYTPSPLLGHEMNRANNNSFILKQNNLSTSYQKLKKFKISDTNLAFVHKLKGNLLRKHINKLPQPLKSKDQLGFPSPSPKSYQVQEKSDKISSIIDHLLKLREKININNSKVSSIKRIEQRILPKLQSRKKAFRSCERTRFIQNRNNIRELVTRGIQVENNDLCAWEMDGDYNI